MHVCRGSSSGSSGARKSRRSKRNRRKSRRARGSTLRRHLAIDPLEDRRMLAVLNVTTTADVIDPNDGQMSLREAIIASNTTPGTDTIILPSGQYDLTRAGKGEDAARTGDLDILDSVTIFGAGAGKVLRGEQLLPGQNELLSPPTIINASGLDRVFEVLIGPQSSGNPKVKIAGVEITGGSEDVGGGLLNRGGVVTLADSAIRGNEAFSAGGSFYNDISDPDVNRRGLVRLTNTRMFDNTTNGINREEALTRSATLIVDAAGEILDAVDTFFDKMLTAVEPAFATFDLPIIGDQLREGLEPVIDAFQTMRTETRDFLSEVLSFSRGAIEKYPGVTVPELVQNALFLALAPFDNGLAKLSDLFKDAFVGLGIDIPKFNLNLLKDGPDLGAGIDPDDIVFELGQDREGTYWFEFRFQVGQRIVFDLPDFDLGFDDIARFMTGKNSLGQDEDFGSFFDGFLNTLGFNVSASNGIRFDMRWDARLGFGLSEIASQNVYLVSFATENGLPDGPSVEELRAKIDVYAAPSTEAVSFGDLFTDVVTTPNLSATANLGFIQAKITDGTPAAVQVTAPRGIDIELDDTYNVDLEIIVDDNDPVRIDVPNVPTIGLLPVLNGAIIAAFKTPLPPVNFSLDFSRIDAFFNPNSPTTPSLLLNARYPEINRLEIRGAENLGFLPVQYENRRVQGMGFGNNAASTATEFQNAGGRQLVKKQELVAEFPAPAEGVMIDSPDWRLWVGGQRVDVDGRTITQGGKAIRITFQEIKNRSIDTLEELRAKLEQLIQGEIASKTNLFPGTVGVEIVNGDRFKLISYADPNDPLSEAPLLTTTFPVVDQTKLRVIAAVDVKNPDDDPAGRKASPNDQRFFNRLPYTTIVANQKNLMNVFSPQLKGKGQVRLHVNVNSDNFTGLIEQALGVTQGTIGLPQVDFDFKVDVDVDLAEALKQAYKVATGDAKPSDLKSLDKLKDVFKISSFQFDNIQLDIRKFMESVALPITDAFVGVLEPAIEFIGDSANDTRSLLNQRLPLISDILDQKVSIAGVIEDIGLGDELDAAIDGFVSVIDAVAGLRDKVESFLDSDEFKQAVDENGKFTFGGLELVFDPTSPFFFPKFKLPLPTDLTSVADSLDEIGIGSFMRTFTALSSTQPPGFSWDLFEPQNIFNLLLGEPLNIVSFGLPTIDFDAGFDVRFGFEDLAFDISGSATFDSNLRFVYDSVGLERIVRTAASGQIPDFRDLLDGFAIQNNKDGFEFGATARFAGTGSIDTPFFEADGRVFITDPDDINLPAYVGLELLDPNNDGKFRLDELFALTNDFRNPERLFCMFDVRAGAAVDIGGSATLIAPNPFGSDLRTDISADMGLNTGAFSLLDLLDSKFKFCGGDGSGSSSTIVGTFKSRPPVLAEPVTIHSKRVLRINTGPFASARLFGDTDDTDGPAEVTVRTDSNGRILVSGFGVTDQVYDGDFSRILAIGGPYGDTFDMSGVADIPVELDGQGGNDTLIGGAGDDQIDGGEGDDDLRGGRGNDTLITGTGANVVSDGGGDDLIDFSDNSVAVSFTTDGGSDTVLGSRFDDTLTATGMRGVRFEGRRGNDILIGALGDDVLIGGLGDDQLVGNEGDDDLQGGFGDDLLSGGDGNDQLRGGQDDDQLAGGAGGDQLFGDQGDDLLDVGFGDLRADGGTGTDRFVYNGVETGSRGRLTGRFYRIDASSLGSATVPYANVEFVDILLTSGDADDLTVGGVTLPLTVDAGGGNDRIRIDSVTSPTVVHLGQGDDTLILARFDDALAFDDGGGTDTLVIDRSAEMTPMAAVMTPTSISGFFNQPVPIDGTIERFEFELGAGDDQLTIEDTNAGAVISVRGNGGDDRITVDKVRGPLTSVIGGEGDDRVTLVVNSAPAGLPSEFGGLGFDVETVTIDNASNATSLDWSLRNRVVYAESGTVEQQFIEAIGAEKVVFLGHPSGLDNVEVRDGRTVDKQIEIAGENVTVTKLEEVLRAEATENGLQAPFKAVQGLNDLVEIVVSPDGRNLYALGDNSINIFEIDPTDRRLFYLGTTVLPVLPARRGLRSGEMKFTPDGFLEVVSENQFFSFQRRASGSLKLVKGAGGAEARFGYGQSDALDVVQLPSGKVRVYQAVRGNRSTNVLPAVLMHQFERSYPGFPKLTTSWIEYDDYGYAVDLDIRPDGQEMLISRTEVGTNRATLETRPISSSSGILGTEKVLSTTLAPGAVKYLDSTTFYYVSKKGPNPTLQLFRRIPGFSGWAPQQTISLPGVAESSSDIRLSSDNKRLYVVLKDTNGVGRTLVHFRILSNSRRLVTRQDIPLGSESTGRIELHPSLPLLFVPVGDGIRVFDITQPNAPVLMQTVTNGSNPTRLIPSIQAIAYGTDDELPDRRKNRVYAVSPTVGALIDMTRLGQPYSVLWQGSGGVVGLRGAVDIDVSVDGDTVFVAAPSETAGRSSLTGFRRGSNTLLQMSDRLSSVAIGTPRLVQVGPGGSTIYLVGTTKSAVVSFNASDGTLARKADIDATGADLAVTSDGDFLYWTDPDADQIRIWQRTDAANYQYTSVGDVALSDPDSIAVSGDDRFVYVGSRAGATLSVFSRDPATGVLTEIQTIRNGEDGVLGMRGLSDVLVSGDDGLVYVAGEEDNTIVVFARDPVSGKLVYVQRLRNGSKGVTGLAAPTELAGNVSGTIVYTANLGDSLNQGGISSFRAVQPTFSPDVGKIIPSQGTITSTLTINDGPSEIDDVDVLLYIVHDNVEDLDVFLTSPSGTRVELFTDVGGTGDNLVATTLDDQAYASIAGGSAPFRGRFRPEGSLDRFLGEDANGVWTLEITDDTASPATLNALTVFGLTFRSVESPRYEMEYDDAVATLEVASANAFDQVSIRDVRIPLTVRTEGGSDQVVVLNTAPGTAAPMFVDLGSSSAPALDGNDTLEIRSVAVGAEPVFRMGAGDDRVFVWSTNTGSLTTIDAGDGADTIRVAADELFGDVSIDGGSPSNNPPAPFDRLLYDAAGLALDPSSNPVVPEGNIQALGRARVSYVDIENLAAITVPQPDSGGPYTTTEGQGVSLAGTVKDPQLFPNALFEWDIDGDGTFGDRVGESVSLEWSDLAAFGIDDDGDYPIALKVTSEAEEYDISSTTISVANVAPVLNVIASPSPVAAGRPVTLNLTASDPGDDTITQWTIDWGDGSELETFEANDATVTHVYADDRVGNNTIAIEAFDEDGGPYTADIVVTVVERPAIVGEESVDEGSVYTLQLQNPGGIVIDQWIIDWGDGKTETVAGTATEATHAYADNGLVRITATARDDTQGVESIVTPWFVEVRNVAPVIDSVAHDGPVDDGSPVTFTVQASDPASADVLTYEFDFDNNGQFEVADSDGVVPHVFPAAGTFTVAMRVRDDDGGLSDVRTLDVTVNNVAPTISAVALQNVATVEGSPAVVRVDASDSAPEGRLTYEFDFDDDGLFEIQTASPTAQHVYGEDGVYFVNVRVTDEDGSSATARLRVDVANADPTIDRADVNRRVTENGPFSLTVLASDPGGANDPLTYEVDFDNNGTFDARNSTGVFDWTFPDDGTFAVGIRVSDDDGGQTIGTLEVTVLNVSPVIDSFAVEPAGGSNREVSVSAAFSDVGLLDTHTAVIDWGDGTRSTTSGGITLNQGSGSGTLSARHTYAEAGVYQVALVVQDDDGGADQAVTETYRTGVALKNGELVIVGTPKRDIVFIRRHKDKIEVKASFLEPHKVAFKADQVKSISAWLLDGADRAYIGGPKHHSTIKVPVSIFAGAGNDDIHSRALQSYIDGGDGNDYLFTGEGDDTIVDLSGNNRVWSGRGDDTITLGAGADKIWSDRGDDVIDAGDGDNRIWAGEGDDSITAGAGDDRISGGHGNDLIDAGDGDNRIHAGEGDDRVTAGDGDDRIDGDDGNDVILAGAGSDKVEGGKGNDIVVGGDGDDEIEGGRGDDLLIGGRGADELEGERGDDMVIAGYTNFDENAQALDEILEKWTKKDTYQARVASLRTGTSPKLLPKVTVFDDGVQDIVKGEKGRDWFFAALDDILEDRDDDEEWDVL